MATERKAVKFDPNTEAFQMRAQWKKQDNCRQQWFERWSWLLDERKSEVTETKSTMERAYPEEAAPYREAMAQADAIRQEASAVTRSQVTVKPDETKSLKPVPLTSTGVVGWLASRPDCRLEIYPGWLTKPPIRLPDTWDHPDYMGPKK